jgi:hypothetical protein
MDVNLVKTFEIATQFRGKEEDCSLNAGVSLCHRVD